MRPAGAARRRAGGHGDRQLLDVALRRGEHARALPGRVEASLVLRPGAAHSRTSERTIADRIIGIRLFSTARAAHDQPRRNDDALGPVRAARMSSSMRSSSSSAAAFPWSSRDQLTVVSGTRRRSPSAMSPAPTTAMSSGTRSPASQIAFIAPIADGSFAQNTASIARRHGEQLLHRAVAVRLLEPAAHDPLGLRLDARPPSARAR